MLETFFGRQNFSTNSFQIFLAPFCGKGRLQQLPVQHPKVISGH
jgi:hypothetical protein